MTTTTTTAKAETTLPAPLQSCSQPGCKAKLASNNTSGKCQEHRSHSKSNGNGAVAAANGNGHAVAEKTNGLDRKPAGANGAIPHSTVSQQLTEERAKILCADKDLVRLILDRIPLEDKMKFTAAWLSGQN